MTATKTQRSQSLRVITLGLTVGLLSGLAGAQTVERAEPSNIPSPSQVASAVVDPAKQLPGKVSITSVDFKRGDGGAGRLILRFNGDGATPDLRTQGSSVVVDIRNASLQPTLQRPLNVSDFATPVQRVDARPSGDGTQIVLNTSGAFESLAYQTGRDYIVEIVPRASGESRAVGATSATATVAGNAQASGTAAYRGKPVTFNFQDVPVRTVLQVIAEESNLNIVAADTVQGNMTLRLINVPWDQALDIVLQAKGLDKRRSGSVIWVAPQPEIAKYELDKETARINIENSAEMVTEYIPVSYGNAEDIAKLLTDESKGNQNGSSGGSGGQVNRGFLSPRGSISFDRRTNTLLVIDIPQRVAAIKDLVVRLDKPVDQVVIEGRIVIATETFARELGAKFGLTGFKDHLLYSNSIGNNIANQNSLVTAADNGGRPTITRGLNVNLPASSTIGNAGALALSILNAGYALDVELSALQNEGRGEVISNPRIVTSNQKEAVIRQGEEIGYLTTNGATSGANAQGQTQVQFKDVLLELRVTPTITNDGRVFLNMNVKKDEVIEFIDSGQGSVPRIAKREVNTAVLIEDGQTVAIGGVYEFKDQRDLSKVPFLGDIPVLGNLFKKRGRSKSKAELLIFVTPKVLRVAQKS